MRLCNKGWQGTLRPWSWCFLNPFERNYLLCTGGWLEDYMGFCAFIGKHIHVFQNVLFLIEIMFIVLRPPLAVFSLNCSQYFSSKEDLHFWTEPTKRDESFSLCLSRWCSGCYCHKHFVLLWSPTQLIWRDVVHTLFSNTLPSMFVAQFWTQVNTLFPPHAQQATHSSRGEGWQCGSCSSSHSSNSIRCGSSIRESVLFSKTCQCSSQCVQFWVLQKVLLREILQCNRLAQKHNARNEGRDIKRLPSLPFPFPLPLQIWAKGTRDTSC